MKVRVEIEVPEDCKDRRWILYAGSRETMLIREPDGSWHRKTVRCNFCGLCCASPGNDWPLGQHEIDGKVYCAKLRKWGGGKEGEFECIAGPDLPLSCVMDMAGAKPHPDCCIEWEKIGEE